MKAFKVIITSFKKTKLHICGFFILSLVIAYLTTYIPVILQYFIDVLLKQNVNNSLIEYFIGLCNNSLSFIPIICILLVVN